MTARRLVSAGQLIGTLVGTLGMATVMALPMALVMSAAGRHTSVVGPEARHPHG